jgi:MYXO-CTERM domain-containing protein
MRRSVVVLSSIIGLAFAAGVARADIAPPDLCTSPGQPCQNAGAVINNQPGQPGLCTATTCAKSTRNTDGGFTSTSYACNRCLPTDAGTASSDGSGGSTGSGSAGSSGSTKSSGSSGCAIAAGRADHRSSGGALVLVALGLMAAVRRRHGAV